MIWQYEEKSTLALFIMHFSNPELVGKGLYPVASAPVNTFVYNRGEAQLVTIDQVVYTMPAASVLPLVSNQHFAFEHPEKLIAWQFNREFYCIVEHDSEVGCVGFLFYGIQHPMFITLDKVERESMDQLEKIFSEEWNSKDNFQGEMLRTLLKQLIIRTTRKAKKQCDSYNQFEEETMNIVRKFMLILEGSFKKEHSVRFYATALNKSPKTLSNIFALLKQPPPSKLIQNRIILEAKRYVHYTGKSAKEIAFELNFESPAHFSRFFKLYSGTTISEFRRAYQKAHSKK
ncbi:helix-turn-helix domain-containing protein [Flavobacterium sp. FlaQc-48]|uniref:helix-turn-helix domain-containing protein n=1 Tax=Flavobacterium sp. FlaQc-48 TaxID=3374181 RepID=UPI003757551A